MNAESELIIMGNTGEATMAGKVSRFPRNGFTLIELLVVVVLIGLLASLVLPAFAKGRTVSQEAQCKNNLRQMSLALEMYLADSDGLFPTYEWVSKEQRFNWDIAIAGYLGRARAVGKRATSVHCPTGRQGVLHETVPGRVFSFSASPTYGYNSFGYVSPANAPGAGLGGVDLQVDGENRVVPTRESHLNNAADMLALGDGFRVRPGTIGLEESYYLGRVPNIGFRSVGEWLSSKGREERLAEGRHQSRLNMAFSDGHVVSGKIEQWYFSKAETEIRRWRTDNKAE